MGNLFDILDKLAEERIREAMERGEFDNLPGRGQRVVLEDDRHIPEDLRMAYKILKNADCVPPEIELRKEIRSTEQLLDGIKDTREKYRQIKKLNYLILKLNMSRQVSPLLEENQRYYAKVLEKVKPNKES